MFDLEMLEAWHEYNDHNLPLTFAEFCYQQGRTDAINEIYNDLSTEIALLNEADMTDANLYTFAVRIKEITDKLIMK